MAKNEDQNKVFIDALTQHNVYLQRLATSAVGEMSKAFDEAMSEHSVDILRALEGMTDTEKKLFAGGSYTTSRLKSFRDLLVSIAKIIADTLSPLFRKSGEDLAQYEGNYTRRLAGEKKDKSNGAKLYALAVAVPFAGGVLAKNVIPKIATDTRTKIEQVIRDGVSSGQTNTDIIKRIMGSRELGYQDGEVQKIKNELDAIVRTTRAHISNETYTQTWLDLGYEYVKVVATLDGRTTLGCAGLDGKVYKIGTAFAKPPYHYRCRTVLVGCDKDGKIGGLRPYVADNKPVKKIPKDERDEKIGQVSANTKYASWFKTQNASFQRDVLGSSRYELYKKGGYTIDKFVDYNNGNRLFTLDELKAKDEQSFKNLGL